MCNGSRSNVVDRAGWPQIRLLNRDSGNILLIFPRKKQRNPEFTKTREGWNCRFQKTSRTEGWVKVQGSVDPRFAAGLPFLVLQIL